MKKLKKKRTNIEQANKRRVKKRISRKKRFNVRVDKVADIFLQKDNGLTFSQAKSKALKLMLS